MKDKSWHTVAMDENNEDGSEKGEKAVQSRDYRWSEQLHDMTAGSFMEDIGPQHVFEPSSRPDVYFSCLGPYNNNQFYCCQMKPLLFFV